MKRSDSSAVQSDLNSEIRSWIDVADWIKKHAGAQGFLFLVAGNFVKTLAQYSPESSPYTVVRHLGDALSKNAELKEIVGTALDFADVLLAAEEYERSSGHKSGSV